MPFVRIFLRAGTSPEYRKALGDGVHRALAETIAIPASGHFQVISVYSESDLIYDPGYLAVYRSYPFVLLQIISSNGRKPQQKRKLFKRIAEILAESPGLPPQDLMTVLVETSWENWSFGNDEAQYLDS